MSPRRELLTSDTIDAFVESADLVLLECWAPWSGDAFLIGQSIDRLLRMRPDWRLRLGRVDVDAHPDVAARFHAVVPMLLLFRDGELVGRHRRLTTPDALASWLDAVSRSPSSSSRPEGEALP